LSTDILWPSENGKVGIGNTIVKEMQNGLNFEENNPVNAKK
jgi:hypothetical protein